MNTGRYIFGGILILVGISALTGFNVFRYLIPALLILWGWSVLTGNRWHPSHHMHDDHKTTSGKSNTLNETLVFSGAQREIVSSNFQNGKVVAVFGGGEFDLSNVKVTSKEVKLEVHAAFGGIRIRVPQNWQIESEVVSVLGGFDNRTKVVGTPVKVIVTGSAILGGVEIYN